MIELPEAAVLAKQINQTLSGKRIKQVIADQSPHKFAWYSGDPARYNDRMAGKVLRGAEPFGGHLGIRADDMLLVISTPIPYHGRDEKLPKKHQLLVTFEDVSAISCTVQMWGALDCFGENEKSSIPDYLISREKPSPLSDEFDRAYFHSLFHENTGNFSAKAFLATEQCTVSTRPWPTRSSRSRRSAESWSSRTPGRSGCGPTSLS